MKKPASLDQVADKVAARFRKHHIDLTLGGEPSYVPFEPGGLEWSVTAVGPTKLRYAYAFADALIEKFLPKAIAFFSPGKLYPGEVNPRWSVNLLWPRDGEPLVPATVEAGARDPGGRAMPTPRTLQRLRKDLLQSLRVANCWTRAIDATDANREVWALPLDHDGARWITQRWPFRGANALTLLKAEGPAGLRLPLNLLPEGVMKRALVLEAKDDGLHVFTPPFLLPAFLELMRHLGHALRAAGAGKVFFEGYVPDDSGSALSKLSLTPDPGVLEVNLPPCENWREYRDWMSALETCAHAAKLRSFKQTATGASAGTGGGNHILFGGPAFERHPFFTRPRWLTSILRYWQHHPSLAYLFTGDYVGPSSQAPRTDESGWELYDLEMAYQFLENLTPGGDHRQIINETLRHLHADSSGNTHRSEISFDKFWNTHWPGGSRGLVEFRAVESLPHAEWMSAVALLWQALAAFLFESQDARPLVDFGTQLHDRFFLPTPLWQDFATVLRDLRKAGFDFPQEIFRAIWESRFPASLRFASGGARLTVRKAREGWPLLAETPLEGGTTSRFVDTSMERLEFLANKAFARTHRVFVQGRELPLEKFPGGKIGAALRYRRSALYPSLHPGIAPHMPLFVTVVSGVAAKHYKLDENSASFCETASAIPLARDACKKMRPEFSTYDLRLG
jgi:uncharacterized protein (DUF2126 family)